MKFWKLVLATLAVFSLVAAACGDDDDATSGDGASADGGGSSGVVFDVDGALSADLANCGDAPSGDPLVIGFAADFSEAGGFADVPISEAAAHFVDLVNCAGGADGTPVELVIEDVQGDPEVAQRATADLIEAGAHVILGPPFADTGTAVLQTVEGSRAVIFVASTEPVLPDPSISSFLTTFDDTAQAEAMAQFAIDEGFARAITFSSEGPYFGYNPETFAAKFEELGGEVVLDQSYVPFEDFDFATQANEVANVADGTEILYTAMIAPQLDALRGQLEERGVDIAYAGADAFEVSGITEIPNNEGVYWTSHGFPDGGNRFEQLLASLDAAGTSSEAPGFAGLAGDAITMAIQGFLNAGSTDPAVIAEAIGNLSGVSAVTDTLTYAGTTGVPDTPVYILQISGGEMVLATKGRHLPSTGPMLEIDNLTTRYGAISALRGVNLSVGTNEVVGLIGPNGAGKTTLLNSVAGLLRPSEGQVRVNDAVTTGASPDAMLRRGLALVPEHRRLFAQMSVIENLRIGGITASGPDRARLLEEMVELFPVLRDKWHTPAGFLSGGEAQQLAIARALMSDPQIVLMDEPSLGLAPVLVDLVFDLIARLRADGRTLLVVEQNATRLLAVADRAYVLRTGEIAAEGAAADLLARRDLFDTFVGGSREGSE